MKLIYTMALLMCLTYSHTYSQNDWSHLTKKEMEGISGDSLKTILAAHQGEDTVKMNLLNELAFKYRKDRSVRVKARQWALDAQKLALKFEDPPGLADSWIRLGQLSQRDGKIEEAEGHYLKGLDIRINLPDLKGAAGVCNNLGLMFSGYDDQKALKYFADGLEFLREKPPLDVKGRLHTNLGDLFMQMEKYEQARDQFKEGLTVYQKTNNLIGKADILLNMGGLLQELGDYTGAETNILQSRAIYQNSNILAQVAKCNIALGNNFYYTQRFEEAMQNYQKVNTSKLSLSDLALLQWNTGSAYYELEQYDSALTSYQGSLSNFNSLRNKRSIAGVNYNIGNVYKALGQLDTAFLYYQNSVYTLNSIPISKLDSSWPETRLLERNRLNKESMLFEMAYLDTRSKLDTLASKVALEKEKQQKLIAFGLIWLLLYVLILLYYHFRQRRKQTLRDIDYLLTQQQLEIESAQKEVQKKEQSRIAKDLHDRLGSMLSTIKLYFTSIDEKINHLQTENRQQYQKANDLLDEACVEVRNIAHNLRSLILIKFGLKAQVESLANTLTESKKIKVELVTHRMDERMDDKQEENIYRIIQELVANVLKFARATNITIQLNRFQDVLNIMVEDDGVGFNVERAFNRKGMGLSNIKERVDQMEGKFEIDSKRGKGTTVSIDLPYKPAQL